jgi:hypothetical protein
MQFRGKITEAEFFAVQKTLRPKMYWPKLFLANWYGVGIICAMLWATISGFLGYTKPNWRAAGLIWLVVASIAGWAVYRAKSAKDLELRQLNASLPDWVTLSDQGVKFDGPNGATAIQPWRNFKGWREAQRVILLEQSDGNQFVILPTGELLEIECQTIQRFVQSHIPSVNVRTS